MINNYIPPNIEMNVHVIGDKEVTWDVTELEFTYSIMNN